MTTIEEGKRLIRAQLGEDIKQAVHEIQAAGNLTFAQAWEAARSRNPDLFARAERIEADDWSLSPKRSVFRYTGTAKKSPPLGAFKVQALEKPKDDGLMLVMAEDGSIADLVLERR
jgi:hypothetical protein